jgi:hypothetical protein
MQLPTSVVITGCDTVGILKPAVKSAATLAPPSTAQIAGLLNRTANVARRGQWEKYKTSEGFDGTAQHPWWLETASLAKPA